MSITRHHAEWLSLLDISGPFLSLKVLASAFPQGIDAPDADVARELRLAYEEWLDNAFGNRPDPDIHRAWVAWVLRRVLEMPSEVLHDQRHVMDDSQQIVVKVPEYGEELRPDFVIAEPGEDGKIRLLVQIVPANQDLEKAATKATWQASPATRMMTLLRGSGVRLGLVTNGEQWMLVDRPTDENVTTGFASWYARLWLDEPLTLRAFHTLLGAHRFFGVPDKDTIEALLSDSASDRQEVTDQLGYQVRRAVELLVQAIDLADQNEGRALLNEIPEEQLYEAALTVMMRLVFLLFAEEQNLLLLGDDIYDQHYAVSTLMESLREAADRVGEEVLERRYDAWARLLAIFRGVYGGFSHDRLTMPAYGGGLFNPDRFAFLEGRQAGTIWTETPADPLMISNRVVLHLLEALQVLRVRMRDGAPMEARRLSFRALDIEQIGHVYEGLLDHTAIRATEPVLGLAGTRDQEPEIPLADMEREVQRGEAAFLTYLQEHTGRSASALKKAWVAQIDAFRETLLRAACGNDEALYARVLPFAGLVRDDDYGRPIVIPTGSVYVTAGAERRSTGTHYTPRSLTEPIVQHTLEPLVYAGPAEGKSREEWKLRPAAELLQLTVCDMAMGSGAFLVQACRYLSERLLEAWAAAEGNEDGKRRLITADGFLATDLDDLIPADPDERTVFARRLVADRCLYGVDKNPLAVEMARLSLWLITLAKGQPFSFLDHALRAGDSLLGVGNVRQILNWDLAASDGDRGAYRGFLTQPLERALERAGALRRRIQSMPVRDARDADQKQRWLHEAEDAMELVRLAADLLIAAQLHKDRKRRAELSEEFQVRLSVAANAWEDARRDPTLRSEGHRAELAALRREADELLVGRTPFHWPLEFPEVFVEGIGNRVSGSAEDVSMAASLEAVQNNTLHLTADTRGAGFAAIVGNPPFQYGTLATAELGEEYMYTLQRVNPPWHGKADLVVGFFKRTAEVIGDKGFGALIATASLIRGETLESGLRELLRHNFVVYHARSPYKWPGKASLEVVHVAFTRGWQGVFILDGALVPGIEEDLTAGESKVIGPLELLQSVPAYLGVKISPKNNELSLSDISYIASSMKIPLNIFVPLLGGDELYTLVDLANAPRAIDPEALGVWMSSNSTMSSSAKTIRIADYDHAAPAAALTEALKETQLAFACGETSTALRFARVPTSNVILKHKLIVFPTSSWAFFSILQSDIHCSWAWRWGLRRESRIVYSPKRCAKTYPLPDMFSEHWLLLEKLGDGYHQFRQTIMLARNEGLTKTYNRFHNPNETSADIAELRRLHVEMDNAVAAAYGWADLDLDHGFHDTKQGLRYTISEAARRTVLDRLLALNHERYAEEVAAGLHDKKAGSGSRVSGMGKKGRKAKPRAEPGTRNPEPGVEQGELF